MRARHAIAGLALCALACADDSDGGPFPREPASLVIQNSSQFVLDEIRLHRSEDYREVPSILDAPLPIDGTVFRHLSGAWMVTVLRERFRGGDSLALTTMFPLALEDERGYRLHVFDTAFRLESDVYVPTTSTITSTSTGS